MKEKTSQKYKTAGSRNKTNERNVALLKKIPNFSYVFGINNNNKIIIEYIEGQKLFDYIKSDKFDIKEYIFILLQICLSLSVAQNEYCFVHYDLTTWNIILQRLDKEIDIDYNINNVVYSVRTKIIPIIIDYGKSHVVYNNIHYGIINMFKFSTCTDILTLLITSLYQIIIEKKLAKYDYMAVLKIGNFLYPLLLHCMEIICYTFPKIRVWEWNLTS